MNAFFTELHSKINQKLDTKNKKIIAAVVLMSVFALLMPKTSTTTAYVKKPLKICNGKYLCVNYEYMDPIVVVKTNKEMFDVYNKDKSRQIGKVNKNDIVFKGTSEYNDVLKNKQDYETYKSVYSAKSKQEVQRVLANLEPIMKDAFFDIQIKPGDKGNGIFKFYIKPLTWKRLDYKQKETLFGNCATYGALKSGFPNMEDNTKYIQTQILNAKNKEVLAKYSLTKGIELK